MKATSEIKVQDKDLKLVMELVNQDGLRKGKELCWHHTPSTL